MAIEQYKLRIAARRKDATVDAPRSRDEAVRRGQRTAFLSHSHKDRDLAEGIQVLLREHGVEIYLDWQDQEMPERPNAETADRIRKRIATNDLFLFLATEHSEASRWCPWEIGFADGEKGPDDVIVIPTSSNGREYGNEYLQLYQRIELGRSVWTGQEDVLGTFKPGEGLGKVVTRHLVEAG